MKQTKWEKHSARGHVCVESNHVDLTEAEVVAPRAGVAGRGRMGVFHRGTEYWADMKRRSSPARLGAHPCSLCASESATGLFGSA